MSTTALVQNGLTRHRAGQFAEAEPLYRQALAEDPRDAEAWHLLGMLHYQRGRIALAIEHVEHAVQLEPATARYRSNLGIVYRTADRLADAVASGREAVRLKPDVAEAHNSLGVTWQQVARSEPDIVGSSPDAGPWEQAVTCFRAAVRLQPGYIDALNNLGSALCVLGETDEARACCRRALDLDPQHVSAWTNLGAIAHRQGRLDEALEFYEQALRLQPSDENARWNRSLALLTAGKFREGWPEYAWRFQAIEEFRRRTFDEPTWDGSSPAGKTLLVWAEQGFGDTLQFIRYAPLLKRRGATVVVECQASLASLLATCEGVDQVVIRGQTRPAFDFQVPMMSLPGIFQTDLASIPNNVPYLHVDAQRVQQWSTIAGEKEELRVGLVWRGNPRAAWDRQRSFLAEHYRVLAGVPGVQFYSLQVGALANETARLAERLTLVDLAPHLHDFTDTAAALSRLDLLITSDTATAHMAGALGRKVWVALSASADWRWLLEREDCPWYPTMRLFRQSRLGHWSDVMHRLRDELEQAIAASR